MSHLGDTKNFAKKGLQPWKGEVDIEMGGLPLFYYFTAQLRIYCGGAGGEGGGGSKE